MTESELRAVFGANLRHYRGFRGLTQAKLAEKLDISPNFISDLENGKRWLSSDTLVNLSDILDIAVHEFLKPDTPLSEDMGAFMEKYSHEAAVRIFDAVQGALEKLRGKYRKYP
ncbi:MAG: helix-turn-helix domain-containing protein [Spirochaetaceae bacterium]|jgi:transcriptional regulator with XRE-family HTH domain|nr:helix-turn-helix domain-containing protein [Spirochaetaceae bacterium]